jgi:hypothetical protein
LIFQYYPPAHIRSLGDYVVAVFFLELCVITVSLILGGMVLYHKIKYKQEETKTYFTGIFSFFLIYGSAKIFLFISDFYLYPNRFIYAGGRILALLALVAFMIVVESIILKKTKHFFSYFGMACVALMVIFANDETEYFGYQPIQLIEYIAVPVLFAVLLLMYLTLTIRSAGDIRKSSLLMLFGVSIVAFGEITDTSFFKRILPSAPFFAPFLIIGGLIILYQYISKVLYIGLYEKPVKAKLPKKKIEVDAPEVTLIETLIQNRPVDISEEEISIYKEKKICLVCKNRVSKLTYICPGCESFYCVKCSQALMEVENECWACGTLFDESKPILKPEEIKVEDVKAENKPKKLK